MVKKRIEYLLYRWVLPYAGLFIVKLISVTNRMKVVDHDNEQHLISQNKGVIYSSWHQRLFPGITFFARRKPIAIMVSQSRDGEFIAHIGKIIGWEPVRGSSSRGGHEALDRLKELALRGYRIGHIVDGPKGPFGVVKPGLIKIAQATGLPIVPAIMSAQRKWIVNSWDRFMIPKFFSRVIIALGKPVYIPAQLSEADFEKMRRQVESQMAELYAETDQVWTDQGRIRKIFGSA